MIDPASGSGSEGNPAPYLRPAEAVATLTDGNKSGDTFGLHPMCESL